MNKYLKIIQDEIPNVTEEDLYLPIRETVIDSLDLVVIRVALEKHFGFEISDTIWFNFNSIEQSIQYFLSNSDKKIHKSTINGSDLCDNELVEVTMPQMANSALSESWLFKYLGNKHWDLISKGFKKKSSEFYDSLGNRLYSTFIRIKLESSNLKDYTENESIEFTSKIEGFGNNTFITNIIGKSNKNLIKAILATTFSKRDDENNNEISKGETENLHNNIIKSNKSPDLLNDYRLVKKGLIEQISTSFGDFVISEDVITIQEYTIIPYYDINGVGLLYFAAYPIISDTCLQKFLTHTNYLTFHTVFRDVFYFGNCNPKDTIIFKLNYIEQSKNQIRTVTSLFRKSDNKMIAKILTLKRIIK